MKKDEKTPAKLTSVKPKAAAAAPAPQPETATPAFAFIPLSSLSSNTYNARRFDAMTPQRQAKFDELVASVREKGVIEPLLVRPLGEDRYEIIAGERRFRATQQVFSQSPVPSPQSPTLPCMIRDVSDDEAFDLMLIENLHRDDLSPFETAQAFSDYLKRHGDTQEAALDLSIRTGLPVYAIRRQVRILRLPEQVVTAWKSGTITQSHAELFTRIPEEAQAVELLAVCIRLKLSTRELAARIGDAAPDLDKGFFDKGECQACHFNTSIQSALFIDDTPTGKCCNSPCFEAKQGSFLTENWQSSKASEKYGTRGYRFSHRLDGEHYQPSPTQETAERCKGCDTFISLVRLTGAVVGRYERTCVGPRACFEELYTEKPEPAKEEEKPEEAPESPASDASHQSDKSEPQKPAAPAPAPKSTPAPGSKSQAPEDTGPVYNGPRGERFRELFFKTALPETIEKTLPDCLLSMRLFVLSLSLASAAARKCVDASLGLERHLTASDLAKEIFEVPLEDVKGLIQKAAVAHLLDSTVTHATRRFVADAFGIDIAKEWALNKDYLDSLTVSEVVRVGEEELVGIWDADEVREARKKYKGKALRSLKKSELVALIVDSGAELKGRVPAEVLGQRKG